MRFHVCLFGLFFIVVLTGKWCPGQILPKRDDNLIDFAFVGGSFFTTRAKGDREVIAKALHSMFLAAGDTKATFRIENFFDEDELFNRMKKGEVYTAGVSHKFFTLHEKELNLCPLVIPVLDGKDHQSFVLFSKMGNVKIQSVSDLDGKKVASPMYMDDWFYTHSRKKDMPAHLEFEKMPESKSVIMAILYGKVEGGILPESFLTKYLKLKPHFAKKLRILGKTKQWIQPPVICSKDVINAEDREKIITLFLESSDNPKVSAYMELLDVTAYKRVKPEEIRRAR
jgi:hypothetical protein